MLDLDRISINFMEIFCSPGDSNEKYEDKTKKQKQRRA